MEIDFEEQIVILAYLENLYIIFIQHEVIYNLGQLRRPINYFLYQQK